MRLGEHRRSPRNVRAEVDVKVHYYPFPRIGIQYLCNGSSSTPVAWVMRLGDIGSSEGYNRLALYLVAGTTFAAVWLRRSCGYTESLRLVHTSSTHEPALERPE